MGIPGNNLRDNLFMTPRIKCPWCKQETISENHGAKGWFIGCVNSDCYIKPSFWAKDEDEALRVWNSAGHQKEQSQRH